MRRLVFSLMLLVSACDSGSNFSAESGRSADSKKPTLETSTTTATQVPVTPVVPQPFPTSTATSTLPADLGNTVVVPQGAITKGSFTAWAEPPNPSPLQNYWIHVTVKLPPDVTNYTQEDLSGILIGTDGYRRGIGRDSQQQGGLAPWMDVFRPKDKFEFSNGTAKISIAVPGAESMVRDTIEIRSELLQENQSLAIIFK